MSKQSILSEALRLPDAHLTQKAFDRLTRLVRVTMNVPVALLFIGNQNVTLFESRSRLSSAASDFATVFSNPVFRRAVVRCSSDSLVLSEGGLSFATVPLVSDSGMVLGVLSVCAEDRAWNQDELLLLRDFAASATSECALYFLKIEQAVTAMQGSVVMYLATSDHQPFYVSSQIEPLFGFSPAEWLRQPVRALDGLPQTVGRLPVDNRVAVADVYANGSTPRVATKIADKHPLRDEYQVMKPDGSVIWVQDEKRLMYHHNKNDHDHQEDQPQVVLGWLRMVNENPLIHKPATLADYEPSPKIRPIPSVSKTLLLEGALRESEQRYHQLVEHFPETIVVHSEGKILYINPAGVALLGASNNNELIGQPFLEFVHPDYQAIHTRSLKHSAADQERANFIQHKLVRLDEKSAEVLMREIPIKHDGKPAVQAIIIDITERLQTETALRQRENRFRGMVENSSDAVVLISGKGTILYISPSTNRILKYNEGEMIGRSPIEFIHPDDLQETMFRLAQLVQQPGHIMKDEYRLRSKDGSWRWVEGVAKNGLNEPGLEAIILNHRDITERKEAEAALRVSQERYALAADGANDGLWDWNLESDELYISARWKAMLGYNGREMGKHPNEWFERVHPEDIIPLKQQLNAHMAGKTDHFENEYRILHKKGTYHWMLSRGLAVRNEQGQAYRIAGSQTDITERKHDEEQLLYQAFHDPLTALPNRALFMKRLEEAIADAHQNQGINEPSFAVLYLDFDRFKLVNDSYGHLAGDELLIKIARRLEKYIGPNDMVARLGGDEFTILLKKIEHIHDAIALAEQIQQALTLPFKLNGEEIFISASIGIVSGDEHYEQAEYVLRDADIAMYQAKALGKARHEVFDEHMHLAAMALLQLENDLRRAIERQEFLLHYQPLVSMKNGQPVGFEALVRWQHPTRGMVSPAEFIPAAEETGLIVQLGEWVLRTACEQMSKWQPQFPASPPLTISVNLSSKQLSKPDLVFKVARILQETGLNATSLKLEITESVMMEQTDTANKTLDELRGLGIELQLDDFGTGYSSLGYLQKLPVAAIKIDRSFIRYIEGSTEHIEIVRAIVILARNLSMKVVAEGIETTEQEELLRSLGCDYGQGYLFARPLPSREVEKLLAQSVLT